MSKFTFTLNQQTDVTTLRLAGKLDVVTVRLLAHPVDDIVASRPHRVEVDLQGLDMIDSGGVAALVKFYKRVEAEGGIFSVIHARDQPLAIFKLLRMDKVFLSPTR